VFLALKVIDKKPLLDEAKSVVVYNERKVLMALDHPFIAHMHYALETERYVVIALEYCCGGELFYHLRQQRRMKEADARFYFVELLSALKAMHEKGIVYRDLKPENVILDATGHVRLTDFGLSKFLTED
jgi:serine/threonine protein kinase